VVRQKLAVIYGCGSYKRQLPKLHGVSTSGCGERGGVTFCVSDENRIGQVAESEIIATDRREWEGLVNREYWEAKMAFSGC